MTDNEIIKALECCTKGTTSDVCSDCPLRTTDICTEEENGVLKLALDLITRQQAEIIKTRRDLLNEIYALEHQLETTKAEAIKEFAENYKTEINERYEDIAYKDLFFGVIDYIVKEMVGEG